MLHLLEQLRAGLQGRHLRLDRTLFEFETPIAPETFANIACAWWIVPALTSADEVVPGDTLYGASKITFTDDCKILDLRELWTIDPFSTNRQLMETRLL